MDVWSWRALFVAPVPLLCGAWLVGYFVLPFDAAGADANAQSPRRAQPAAAAGQADWAGSLVLALWVSALLLWVNRGNEWGWASPAILATLLAVLLLTPLLVYVELRATHPIVPFIVSTFTMMRSDDATPLNVG
jgi:hypothetical protein